MKKVIALWGRSNVGKSSTIKKAYELLSAKYPNAERDHEPATVDIRIVITIRGIKVRIESQRDPGSRLEETLRLFVKLGCRIIVCATRTKGQTVKAVVKLKPGYEVQWVEQVAVKSSDQESSNLRAAKQIVKEVENLLHA